MQAHLLSLDDFNMPKVLDSHYANYMHIVYLLLLEKGKFQNHPNMGIDIKRYRYDDSEEVLYELREDIKAQIELYLPELVGVEDVIIQLLEGEQLLGIVIQTSEGAYSISYNFNTGEIGMGSEHVLEELTN